MAEPGSVAPGRHRIVLLEVCEEYHYGGADRAKHQDHAEEDPASRSCRNSIVKHAFPCYGIPINNVEHDRAKRANQAWYPVGAAYEARGSDEDARIRMLVPTALILPDYTVGVRLHQALKKDIPAHSYDHST